MKNLPPKRAALVAALALSLGASSALADTSVVLRQDPIDVLKAKDPIDVLSPQDTSVVL